METNSNVRIVPVDLPANAPWLPTLFRQEEARAIKALAEGHADAAQQGIAFRSIVYRLSELNGTGYFPEERDHVFSSGKRFVGFEMMRAAKMTPEQINNLPRFALGTPSGELDEIHDR